MIIRDQMSERRRAPEGSGSALGEIPRVTPEEVERRLADLVPLVRFRVVAEREEVVIRVLDPATDRVLRQIPAADLLELRRRLDLSIGCLARGAA